LVKSWPDLEELYHHCRKTAREPDAIRRRRRSLAKVTAWPENGVQLQWNRGGHEENIDLAVARKANFAALLAHARVIQQPLDFRSRKGSRQKLPLEVSQRHAEQSRERAV
jgi:hypothetical protein